MNVRAGATGAVRAIGAGVGVAARIVGAGGAGGGVTAICGVTEAGAGAGVFV